MKIGILGTGMVGATIGSKLTELGHEVMMGSRAAANEKAVTWAASAGSKASQGSFSDCAAFGEMLFNCTSGGASLKALSLAGEINLEGKVLVDVANPLDFSQGMPPSLFPELSNTTSLAEEIQKAFPKALVVKALNTMNCKLMVNPALLPGEHDVFICGNNEDSRDQVRRLLETFGWKQVTDLGDLSAARGLEMILPLWVRLYGHNKSPEFNFRIVRQS